VTSLNFAPATGCTGGRTCQDLPCLPRSCTSAKGPVKRSPCAKGPAAKKPRTAYMRGHHGCTGVSHPRTTRADMALAMPVTIASSQRANARLRNRTRQPRAGQVGDTSACMPGTGAPSRSAV
jgi:hypothetical protein